MAYIYNLYELEDIQIGPDYSTAHGGWVLGERIQFLLYNKDKGTGSRPTATPTNSSSSSSRAGHTPRSTARRRSSGPARWSTCRPIPFTTWWPSPARTWST
jgi:hypothetical protein